AATAASTTAAPIPRSRLMVRQRAGTPGLRQGTQVPCNRRLDARGSAPSGPTPSPGARMSRRARLSLPFVSVLMALLLAPAIGRAATTDAEVQRGLRGLVQ